MGTGTIETFLGVSSTGWTALSAIAIFFSVLVALFGEKIENYFKKRKILKSLDYELKNNCKKLEIIQDMGIYSSSENEEILRHNTTTLTIETRNINKATLSIIDPTKFAEYKLIYDNIKFIMYEFENLKEIDERWYINNEPNIINKFYYIRKNKIKKLLDLDLVKNKINLQND